MKTVILFIMALFLVNCGGEPTAPSIKHYAYVFISMGQSNARGIQLPNESDIELQNVKILSKLDNKLHEYPDRVVWSNFKTSVHNLSLIGQTEVIYNNASVALAKQWQSAYAAGVVDDDLYLITIAKDSQGISPNLPRAYNAWMMGREDSDQNSLHPQTLHILEKAFDSIRESGRVPVIVGINWNQWESNAPFLDDVYRIYSDFFDSIEASIPNIAPVYLYKPLSPYYSDDFRNIIYTAFLNIQTEKPYFDIIDPTDSNETEIFFDYNRMHYTSRVHSWFGEYIFQKTIKFIRGDR